MFFVIAKYTSKYGLIVYAAKVSNEENLDINFENVYIHTLYFKGSQEIKINEVYKFQTLKGENGLNYAFL